MPCDLGPYLTLFGLGIDCVGFAILAVDLLSMLKDQAALTRYLAEQRASTIRKQSILMLGSGDPEQGKKNRARAEEHIAAARDEEDQIHHYRKTTMRFAVFLILAGFILQLAGALCSVIVPT